MKIKKIQINKLSIESIKKLIAIANSLDETHSEISDSIDILLLKNQDQEEIIEALKNEVSEEKALEIMDVSKSL
tara:strand:+ start:120 stop:341 length:222 start_codon:yes stop_codon:yes gene_type:complete